MAIVQNGLVAYYNSNEGVSGNTWENIAPETEGNYNLTVNGAIWSEDGFQFDGVDDHCLTTENIDPFGSNEEFTFTGWCLNDGGGNNLHGFISMLEQSSSSGRVPKNGTLYRWLDGYGLEYINVNGSQEWYEPSEDLIFDELIHLTMTYDGTTFRFYQNGQFSGEYTPSPTIYLAPERLSIGRWGVEHDNYYWSGIIQSAMIYDRALTEQEIVQNYENGTSVGLEPEVNEVTGDVSLSVFSTFSSDSKVVKISESDLIVNSHITASSIRQQYGTVNAQVISDLAIDVQRIKTTGSEFQTASTVAALAERVRSTEISMVGVSDKTAEHTRSRLADINVSGDSDVQTDGYKVLRSGAVLSSETTLITDVEKIKFGLASIFAESEAIISSIRVTYTGAELSSETALNALTNVIRNAQSNLSVESALTVVSESDTIITDVFGSAELSAGSNAQTDAIKSPLGTSVLATSFGILASGIRIQFGTAEKNISAQKDTEALRSRTIDLSMSSVSSLNALMVRSKYAEAEMDVHAIFAGDYIRHRLSDIDLSTLVDLLATVQAIRNSGAELYGMTDIQIGAMGDILASAIFSVLSSTDIVGLKTSYVNADLIGMTQVIAEYVRSKSAASTLPATTNAVFNHQRIRSASFDAIVHGLMESLGRRVRVAEIDLSSASIFDINAIVAGYSGAFLSAQSSMAIQPIIVRSASVTKSAVGLFDINYILDRFTSSDLFVLSDLASFATLSRLSSADLVGLSDASIDGKRVATVNTILSGSAGFLVDAITYTGQLAEIHLNVNASLTVEPFKINGLSGSASIKASGTVDIDPLIYRKAEINMASNAGLSANGFIGFVSITIGSASLHASSIATIQIRDIHPIRIKISAQIQKEFSFSGSYGSEQLSGKKKPTRITGTRSANGRTGTKSDSSHTGELRGRY